MAQLLVEEQRDWRQWVTPKLLGEKPIHRWYVFPHSFTSELVTTLIHEWSLSEDDHILDPFVGAGTTVLAAKEVGIPASGYDLSPLATFVAKTKTRHFNISELGIAWRQLRKGFDGTKWNGPTREYPELVRQALPGKLLGAFDALDRQIDALVSPERDFFRLALLATIPQYSRAIATGGWLKWIDGGARTSSLITNFSGRVTEMLADLRIVNLSNKSLWYIHKADSRQLPDPANTYSSVISSPPYPNRHDYTRVFGVELMFGFLNWEKTRQLRYQSFHSHPEARPDRPKIEEYMPPALLTRIVSRVRCQDVDPRVPTLLEGYFLDMALTLKELRRVCRPSAKIALVLGNAQYGGISIPVDEITAKIGIQLGLECLKIVPVRYRGNSAQQMGRFGRNPSRESIVVFRKPAKNPSIHK